MSGIDQKKTGQKIKRLCQQNGLSVKDIQEKLFLSSHQAVYAWFAGKSLPSVDNLYQLSRLLGVTMDALVVGKDETGWAPEGDLLFRRAFAARMAGYLRELSRMAA